MICVLYIEIMIYVSRNDVLGQMILKRELDGASLDPGLPWMIAKQTPDVISLNGRGHLYPYHYMICYT